MRVTFITTKDKNLFEIEMGMAPRRDELIVTDEALYEVVSVKHVFKGKTYIGRGTYGITVIVKPL